MANSTPAARRRQRDATADASRSVPAASRPDRDNYVYRRRLETRDNLTALGAGIGVGVVVFYVARLFLQRTPLDPGEMRAHLRESTRTGG